MNATKETVSEIANVQSVKPEAKAPVTKAVTPEDQARMDALKNAPRFKVQGREVNCLLLTESLQRLNADSGRLEKLAIDNKLGTERKTISGKVIRIPDTKAVMELGRRGLLGDSQKTKERIANVKALNALIDSLVHLGLLEREDA